MSNIVLNVGSLLSNIGYEALEKWRDLGIDAVHNDNYKHMDTVYLSSYVQWLMAEHQDSLYEESNPLSNILIENLVVDENNLSASLSALAVLVKGGYDTAKDLYLKYTTPHRWRVSKLVNVKAVESSLHHIFTWTPGERIINPEFGNRLRLYLYEGITEYNVEQIMAEIRACTSTWEPRANIVDILDASTIEDTESNTVHLIITYTIPDLSDLQFEYSFYYKRGG